MKSRLASFVVIFLLVGLTFADPSSDQTNSGEPRFWSFRPVRAIVPPSVGTQDRLQSAVDSFIVAKLEERGLTPSSLADKRTLLRRATFDLTGLPPEPEEIDAFLADNSPEAFSKVVDRLLASPAHGERWGRHWLDVVRYADARDLIQLPAESDFREAWRYRDWVVASFNRDLPYDQFVSQQVAGDLLQPADPNQIDADALVATGLLAIADFVPGEVDKQQMIADYVNDQIDVVGRAFLGLTLACARCHDHKFDPISIDDYYSLAGIFFSTRLIPGPVKGNTPLIRVPLISAAESAALQASQSRDKQRLIELSREILQLGEREYWDYLNRKVRHESHRYLVAAWEYMQLSDSPTRPSPTEFGKSIGLEVTVLTRWIEYFQESPPHVALTRLRAASDKAAAEYEATELAGKLSALAGNPSNADALNPLSQPFSQSPVFQFRADDRRIVKNDDTHVTLWPNRGQALANASPVSDVAAPVAGTVVINGTERPVLRFSGNELLQVPGTAPPAGSLFVVFRPDPAGSTGQRLVGWEDAAVGQHGLGIMTDATGSVHAILRRNGTNGDVVVPAPNSLEASSEFQVLSITWGPNGVAVYRRGQPVGSNNAIDSVSSDPGITSLRIGGPGSGSSARFNGALAELRVYAQPLDDQSRSHVESELMRHWSFTRGNAERVDPVADLYRELTSAQSPFRLEPAERAGALPEDFRQRLIDLQREQATLQNKPPLNIPQAVVVQDGGPADTPHAGFQDAKIYLRGNPATPGPTVPRGFPKSLAKAPPTAIREGSGRRELALWLTDPDHPLTARVMVNRIWQHHFGIGLVSTSANFGEMGERPTHPELLDYLAARFVASGWSVKSMHRLIMLSNVYQQSSATGNAGLSIDPENRLLWRANRRRLEAEAVRDNLLAVAGRLNLGSGGPGSQDVSVARRSLYLMAVRTGAKAAEFGPLFDAPDCSGIVERRTESIVAPQALFLMNDRWVEELAQALRDRCAGGNATGSDQDRIQSLYQIALGRPATQTEVEIGLQFLNEQSQSDSWTRYCHLILCTNEFLFVD